MSIATEISRFIAETPYEEIPQEVIEVSRFALADWLGVTCAGARSQMAQPILDYVRATAKPGECSLPGRSERFGESGAIFAQGTLSHALDYDDVGLTVINHPSVTVAPLVMVLGESRRVCGREALRAFTLAAEVEHKLCGLLMPELTGRGWHTTSVAGTIGAVVAASIMMGLSREQTVYALGISASLAGGLRANFGTATKSCHAGFAAENGWRAATMAACGFTSSPAAFEGGDGYGLAFTGQQLKKEALHLGREGGSEWDALTAGFQFKKYPVCSSSHATLDAFLQLQREHGFAAAEIEKLTAGVSEFAFRNLLYPRPKTALEAKFSMPWALACCALHGQISLDHFTADPLADRAMVAMMERVDMVLDEAWKDAGILSNEPGIARVELKNGRILSARVDWALGTVHNPLTRKQLFVKFTDCMKGFDVKVQAAVFERIFALEELENVGDLVAMVAAKGQ